MPELLQQSQPSHENTTTPEVARPSWPGMLLENKQQISSAAIAAVEFGRAMPRYGGDLDPDTKVRLNKMIITTMSVEDIVKNHAANDLEMRVTGSIVDNIPSSYIERPMPSTKQHVYVILSRHDGAPLAYCLGESNANEFKQMLISSMSTNKELAA